MWTPFQLAIAVTMVVTGSINTLSVKWADKMESKNSDDKMELFNHPFLQATVMFLGESLCIIVFIATIIYSRHTHSKVFDLKPSLESEVKKEEDKSYSPFLLLPPALCDVTATSVMYIALTLTSASSFQMLRGSIMIFVGIFSVIFLRKRLEWFRWFGMVIIFTGLIIVGLSDYLQSTEEEDCNGNFTLLNSTSVECEDSGGLSNELLGDALVVGAQVVAATQFVYEENFIRKYNIPPLKVVGLEGIFGFVTLTILLVPMGYIYVGPDWGHNPDHVLEDAPDGLIQIANNGLLLFALLLTCVSIAFFNFAGVSITKELSATTRKVLDTLRTLVIWACSLAFQWQKFHYLQPIGFIILLVGILIYNDMIILPYMRKLLGKQKTNENSPKG